MAILISFAAGVATTLLFRWREQIYLSVRWYLWVNAGRKFQSRFDGAETRYKLSAQDEAEARTMLVDYEVEDGNYNFLNDSGDVAEGWMH